MLPDTVHFYVAEPPHSRNLLDDLSTSITGTLTMFMIASRQSSQPAATRVWATAFVPAVVSFQATSWMSSSRSVTDRSTNSWPGFKAGLLVNDLLSWASSMLLSECVTISDQGCSPRVIHVPVSEGIAHVQALREGWGSGSRVSSDLCLPGCSGESDCRGTASLSSLTACSTMSFFSVERALRTTRLRSVFTHFNRFRV